MGIKERKEKEKSAMKQLIVNTATDLFMQGGIDHVSIRNIAGIIEYSPATIYLYFSDKDEIIAQLKNNFISDFLSKLKEYGFIKDHFSRLVNFSNSWIDYAVTNPNKYNLIFNDSKLLLQEDIIYLQLFEITSECIHTNRLQRMPRQEAALMILSFLHGMGTQRNRLQKEFKTRQEMQDYMKSLVNRFLVNMKGQAI